MDLEPFLVVFKKVPEILAKTAKFWIPISLLYLGWKLWVSYVREQWLSSVKWVLLEIRVPKEVFKSPAAMELALSNALSQGSVS